MQRRRLCRGSLAAAGLSVLGSTGATPGTGSAPISGQALPPMRRGLNLSHWFEYERGQGATRDELRGLASLGFDHMRIPVDPVVCGWSAAQPSRVPFADDLRQAAEDTVAAGLTVVVDLHLEPSDKERLEAGAPGRDAVVALWGALSRLLADLPPSHAAFELYNEPQFYGLASRHWAPLQQRLLDTVRVQAPRHRVLVSGHQGASIEGLMQLAPLRDPGLTYVFHYYEPFLFTHQGAEWVDTRWSTAGLHRGVRYPAQHQLAAPARLVRPHPRAAREMADYLAQDWGSARIAADLRKAGDWARRHRVPLVCNEFGVLRAHADPGSRYRWLGDVRRGLEAEGIGWAVWDYTDIFGLTPQSARPGQRGARQLEPEAVQALLR